METLHESLERSPEGFEHDLEQLLEMGVRVIPVRRHAKEPMWKHWQFGRQAPRKDGSTPAYSASSATTDRERLRGIPEHGLNVGVPTGQPIGQGFFLNVVDIDPRNGGDVSFTELCDTIGPPPETATVRTCSGGSHIWTLSRTCWTDTPGEIAAGVEFKRAGQFVVAPPSHGYAWINTPWGDGPGTGVSSWGELDAFLGLAMAASPAPAAQEVPTPAPAPALEVWGSVDAHLFAIASAKPGSRNEALLRYGGKIAYATALGAGLGTPAAVAAALWRAGEASGLVDDYPASELLRKIGKFEEWSEASRNPLLLAGGASREHLPVLSPITKGGLQKGKGAPSRRAVLESLGKFARMEFRPYAASYGSKWTGVSRQSAQRALIWLTEQGLIERGGSVYSGVTESGRGKRPTHTYRVTPLGKVALREIGGRS